jgi:multidrug efflux pump subunit AcrA (membrane-fusion protein)
MSTPRPGVGVPRRAAPRWLPRLALAATLAGCSRHDDVAGEAALRVAVHVRLARLAERAFPDIVAASGQWRAANEVVVTAPFAGAVENLRPQVGDRVAAGDTLGLLVTHESRAALRGAELMMRSAADAQARAEAARALEMAKQNLVRVPIVAPAGGIVVRRTADVGAEPAEGAELLAIVPLRALVFEAHVPAAAAPRVRPGLAASIVPETGEPVAASVQRRLPGVSADDQTVLFWLAPRVTPSIGIGRFGTARIEVGSSRNGIAVPDSAVVEDDLTGEKRIVRVGADSVAIWTNVTLGRSTEGAHELLAPALAPGTAVVVAGQRSVPDSVKVIAQ